MVFPITLWVGRSSMFQDLITNDIFYLGCHDGIEGGGVGEEGVGVESPPGFAIYLMLSIALSQLFMQ